MTGGLRTSMRGRAVDEAGTEPEDDDDWFKCCKTFSKTKAATASTELEPEMTCEVSPEETVLAADYND